MIPTLVITLREGVEASLIVGIVAAFLVKQGRRDALGQMWLGVGLAVAICIAVAVALRVIGDELPQRGWLRGRGPVQLRTGGLELGA